jgi:PBP1b-binding outer membrane lipoprotein LpoB
MWTGGDSAVALMIVAALIALLILVAGCAPQTATWEQKNNSPEALGLPMSHLKVETEKVEPSVLGEVEM